MHLSGRNCRHLATWKMSFDQFALYDRVARVGSGSRSGCESSEWIRKSLHLVLLFTFFSSLFFGGMTLEIIVLVFTILSRLSVDFIIDFDDRFFTIIVKIDFPFLAAVYKAFFSRIL